MAEAAGPVPSAAALELPAVLTALAEHCGFAGSAKLALALRPAGSPEEVECLQEETAEALDALDTLPGLSCGGPEELGPILERARVGAVLDQAELLQLRGSISAFNRFGRALAACDQSPGLARRAGRIDPLQPLAGAIDRVIDQHGRVRDQASDELARLRAQIRRRRSDIEAGFGKLVARLAPQGVLTEAIFTVRGGRYVVPLRRESQRQVPGVVHDLSASGATAYIEPLEMVETNNELRALQSGARSEERRVLAGLSEKVRQSAEALAANWLRASALDLILARGKLSLQQQAVRPAIANSNRFDLKAARHPLLGDGAVPIDVHLGEREGFRALVITGSNAGGKTVALKTVGLLHLMAACGLQVPAARGSEVTVFDHVFADIGDQQSITQNLSTFSSHMRNLADALRRAGPRSLVLADEIGAGTDPAEGAALAAAIIDELTGRGAAVVVTTHFGDLKHHAISHPRSQTASVEFDPETLLPKYRLHIGVAGSSHALEIARRSGIPASVCDRARSGIASEQRDLEGLLADMRRQREESALARSEAEAARREAQSQLAGTEREIADRQRRFEDELSRQRAASRRLLREMEALARRQARAAAAGDLESVRGIAREGRRRQHEHDDVSAPVQPGDSTPRLRRAPRAGAKPGDRVELVGHQHPGRILSVHRGGGEYLVVVGGLRQRVPAGSIVRVIGRGPAARPTGRTPRTPTNPVPYRVDLHGTFPDNAGAEVDRHLDRAIAMNRRSVVLVHGLGSGALRDAVRSHLRGHPLVKDYAMGPPTEGGDGVTVVDLR